MHLPDEVPTFALTFPSNLGRWLRAPYPVGYLESTHHYRKGPAGRPWVQRISEHIAAYRKSFPFNGTMGSHSCTLCLSPHRAGSSWDIYLPGERRLYLFPMNIGHYIEAHHYEPPPGFLRALETAPLPGCIEWDEAVLRLNERAPTPLGSSCTTWLSGPTDPADGWIEL